MCQRQHRHPLCAVLTFTIAAVRTQPNTHTHTKIPSVSRKLLTKRNVFPHHVKVGLHNRHHWEQTRSWLMGLKRSTEQSNDVSGHQTHIDRWSCRHITRTHAHTRASRALTSRNQCTAGKKKPGYVRAHEGAQGYHIEFVRYQAGQRNMLQDATVYKRKEARRAQGKIDDR